jgi:ankyrin repeat protein
MAVTLLMLFRVTLSFASNIWEAAFSGDLGTVQNFVEKIGMKVDVTNKIGMSPLYYAVTGGQPAVVQYLIDNKADVNLRLSDGKTPLVFSIDNPNYSIFKELITNKADLQVKVTVSNFVDDSFAANLRRMNKVVNKMSYQALIGKSSLYRDDPDFKMENKVYNLLEYTRYQFLNQNDKRKKIVILNEQKYLLENFPELRQTKTGSMGQDSILDCVLTGDQDQMENLVRQGAEIDPWSVNSAIIFNRTNFLDFFTAASGINSNNRDSFLSFAMEYGPIDTSILLMKNGARLKWRKSYGNSQHIDIYDRSTDFWETFDLPQEKMALIKVSEHGSAWISETGLWGLMGSNFQYIIPPSFEDYREAKSGVVYVKKKGKWGVVSSSGETIIPPVLEQPPAVGVNSWINVDGKFGLFGSTGNFLLQPEFLSISNLTEESGISPGSVLLYDGKNYRVVDSAGLTIVNQSPDRNLVVAEYLEKKKKSEEEQEANEALQSAIQKQNSEQFWSLFKYSPYINGGLFIDGGFAGSRIPGSIIPGFNAGIGSYVKFGDDAGLRMAASFEVTYDNTKTGPSEEPQYNYGTSYIDFGGKIDAEYFVNYMYSSCFYFGVTYGIKQFFSTTTTFSGYTTNADESVTSVSTTANNQALRQYVGGVAGVTFMAAILEGSFMVNFSDAKDLWTFRGKSARGAVLNLPPIPAEICRVFRTKVYHSCCKNHI